MRTSSIHRHTNETDITLTLALDGTGKHEIETGIGFLDHLLTHVAVHGLFDLTVKAVGDLHIDLHHTIEDTALVLGQAFNEALGDRKGIVRMGSAYAPMDESLAFVAMNMLLFARFFPLVPLFEQKEAQVFSSKIKIGRASVPAVLREREQE